jgi:hypothetical protein
METFLHFPLKVFKFFSLEKCSLLCRVTFSMLKNEIFPLKMLHRRYRKIPHYGEQQRSLKNFRLVKGNIMAENMYINICSKILEEFQAGEGKPPGSEQSSSR